MGEDLSSIKLYQTFEVKDSIPANLSLQDSIGNRIDTLFYIKFNPPNKENRLDKFNVTVSNPEILLQKQELITEVKFNKPLKKIIYDSIYYSVDSLTKYLFTQQEIKLDTQKLTITLTKKLPLEAFAKQEETSFNTKKPLIPSVPDTLATKTGILKKTKELVFNFASFISVDNDSSKYMTYKPTYYKEEDLGITLVETNTKEENYFIEILDSKNKIVQRTFNKVSFAFSNLIPGEYSLRLIIDKNKNGKWDPGNYFLKKQPEPIYYYYSDENGEQKFSLKANWELGPLLIKEEYPVNNLSTKNKKTKSK